MDMDMDFSIVFLRHLALPMEMDEMDLLDMDSLNALIPHHALLSRMEIIQIMDMGFMIVPMYPLVAQFRMEELQKKVDMDSMNVKECHLAMQKITGSGVVIRLLDMGFLIVLWYHPAIQLRIKQTMFGVVLIARHHVGLTDKGE